MRGEIKIKTIFIYFVVLISIVITTLLLPKFNQTVFVLKHTFIYLFIASFIVLVVRILYSKLITHYRDILVDTKLTLFRIFTLIIIGLFLFIGRNLQLNYIALYESPPVVFCYYYDEYGNYIHGSRMSYVCPTLEVIEKQDYFLKIRAEYDYPGNRNDHLIRDNYGPYYRGFDGYAIVDMEIEYNDENYITKYTSQTSLNYELLEFRDTDSTDEGVLNTYYSSLLFIIETEYSENLINQSETAYTYEDDNVEYANIEDVTHYDFSNENPIRIQSLELIVTSTEFNKIDFEIYKYNIDDPLRFLGSIEIEDEQTKVFFEYNPEHVNVVPKEISNTYTITEDSIVRSKISGISNNVYTYSKFDSISGYIQTEHINYRSGELHSADISNRFFINNSVILEGRFQTYKAFNTEYGFMIEEYQGDNHKEELPNSSESYLVSFYNGIDHLVFDYANPIELVYDNQPVNNINPMIKYLYRN